MQKRVPIMTFPNGQKAVCGARLGDLRRLRDVALPEGIQVVGQMWFASSWVQSVAIPVSVRVIGTGAFDHCADLESVEFASGSRLEGIEQYGFCQSGLRSIALPPGVRYVGPFAFQECRQLRSVLLNDRLQLLGKTPSQGA